MAPLDCAWIVGDNCWKAMAARAAGCLPPGAESGILSSDLRSCTYAGGAIVRFEASVPLMASPPRVFQFDLTNAGQSCFTFDQDDAGFAVTVANQTVTSSWPGGMEMSVTCPDGTTYATMDAPALQSCIADPSTSFGGVPGYAYSGGAFDASFGLVNARPDSWETLPVWKCSVN
jgi:hypothetical protein